MRRKIFRSGNALVVSLPARELKRLGWQAGTEVEVEVDTRRRQIILQLPEPVDLDLVRWTQEFIERYRAALEELAQR